MFSLSHKLDFLMKLFNVLIWYWPVARLSDVLRDQWKQEELSYLIAEYVGQIHARGSQPLVLVPDALELLPRVPLDFLLHELDVVGVELRDLAVLHPHMLVVLLR